MKRSKTNKKKCGRRVKNKMIEDENARQATFTKGYQELCRKASEFAILCGAQCAIIAESPRGDPLTFAYPSGSADAITQRFLSEEASEEEDAASEDSSDEQERAHEDALSQLEEASEQGSEIPETGATIENDGTGEKANETEVEENEIKGDKGHSDLGPNSDDGPEDA